MSANLPASTRAHSTKAAATTISNALEADDETLTARVAIRLARREVPLGRVLDVHEHDDRKVVRVHGYVATERDLPDALRDELGARIEERRARGGASMHPREEGDEADDAGFAEGCRAESGQKCRSERGRQSGELRGEAWDRSDLLLSWKRGKFSDPRRRRNGGPPS
jgi:hypothetical protein